MLGRKVQSAQHGGLPHGKGLVGHSQDKVEIKAAGRGIEPGGPRLANSAHDIVKGVQAVKQAQFIGVG